MTNKSTLQAFQKYQQTPRENKNYQDYLRSFEMKMIYRTTKTENPETTPKMVKQALSV